MRQKQLERRIDSAMRAIQEEISAHAAGGNMYTRGLAYEGYSGGYLQALRDVDLMLRDVEPNNTNTARYWSRSHDHR